MKKIICPKCNAESSFTKKLNMISGSKMICDECGHIMKYYDYNQIANPRSRDEGAQGNKINDAETVNSRDIEMGKWILIEMVISVLLISCGIYAMYEIFNMEILGQNFAGSPIFFFLIGWIIINIWRLFQLYNLNKLFNYFS